MAHRCGIEKLVKICSQFPQNLLIIGQFCFKLNKTKIFGKVRRLQIITRKKNLLRFLGGKNKIQKFSFKSNYARLILFQIE
jgi:hypothetical protein